MFNISNSYLCKTFCDRVISITEVNLPIKKTTVKNIRVIVSYDYYVRWPSMKSQILGYKNDN